MAQDDEKMLEILSYGFNGLSQAFVILHKCLLNKGALAPARRTSIFRYLGIRLATCR